MIERIKELLKFVYNVRGLIQWGGLSLVGAIVFAETGLFFGFFLPGDSLLVTAGVFARTGTIPLGWLMLLGCACAIAGDQVGYAVGLRTGMALFRRPDSLFFKKEYLLRTQAFYEKYGSKTIVLARFVPIVRTFAPVVAGIGTMRYRRFVVYNVIGGILWVCGMSLAGYSLAALIPHIEQRIHVVIAVVIVLSLLPGAWELWRSRRKARSQSADLAAR